MRQAAARVAALLLLVQVGCETTPERPPAQPKQTVSSFNQALYRNYVELAQRGGGNPLTRAKFEAKAESAARGDVVMPSGADPLFVERVRTAVLRKARLQLLAVMEEGGRLRAPDALAEAQSRFDCWVEWMRTGSGPEDPLAACRAEFEAAMAQLGS